MAKFRTRARAVDLLGKQQIRDEVTAITELLRNSYDADADEGLIDVNTKKDRILVWDDGDGMSRDDIEEKWLTLGTYSKTDKKTRISRKGRVKIGEKGIGRLAISLLGNQCLLITKDREYGRWSILYLHWELFRNQYIFIEEIFLPIKSFNSLEETIHYIRDEITELKKELLQNLNNTSKWDEQIVKKIIDQVDGFNVSEEIFSLLFSIEKKGAGTLFYIKNLENSWEWGVYSSATKDRNLRIKDKRLKNVLSSFQNIFEILKLEEIDEKYTFFPRIHINGVKLEDETWLNKEDLSLFDYALIGKIENGCFKGKALIRTIEGMKEYTEEVDVTEGIYRPNEQDCGPIDIKWFFVEGRDYNSALSKEQHDFISKKLDESGGVYVFRDGLRILPYGEQGNDFLLMEERRSLRAATYLFSHRRMFGYMGISKENNPFLIDKSSREGFVENKEYTYFQTSAINLLVWWATEFLETNDKLGKRASRIAAINQAKEEEKKAQKLKKEEEKRERIYFNQLDKSIENFKSGLNKLTQEVNNELNAIISNNNVPIKEAGSISKLNYCLDQIEQAGIKIINKFDLIKINTNLRYEHTIELLDEIHDLNNLLFQRKEAIYTDFKNNIEQIKNQQKNKLKDNFEVETDDKRVELLNKRIEDAIFSYNSIIRHQLGLLEAKQIEKINSHIELLINEITRRVNKETKEKSIEINYFINQMDRDLKDLNFQKDKLNSLERYMNKEIYEETLLTVKAFENEVSILSGKVYQLEKEISGSEIINNTINSLIILVEKVKQNEFYENDEALIGLLKREVNMFRDISAIGLAAELTSHEFNALYQNIKQSINYLTKALAKTKVLPVLQNINNGFYSLERLHQRMSPLYRQTRSRKNDINVKNFMESTIEYFASDIDRFGIKIVNELPQYHIIREVESILFTPVINLLSNAIYWLINSDRKEIHFYLDPNSNIIYIHDTGKGISEKDEENIFEPYFSRKHEGRGLGLYLSRNILETRGHSLKYVKKENAIKSLPGACFALEINDSSGGVINGD